MYFIFISTYQVFFLIKKFSTSHFICLPLQQTSHPQTQAASKLELGINQPETRQDVIGQLPEAPFFTCCDTTDLFWGVVIISLESKEFIRWLYNNDQVIIMVKLLPITTSWKDPKEHFRKKTYCLFELVGKCGCNSWPGDWNLALWEVPRKELWDPGEFQNTYETHHHHGMGTSFCSELKCFCGYVVITNPQTVDGFQPVELGSLSQSFRDCTWCRIL